MNNLKIIGDLKQFINTIVYFQEMYWKCELELQSKNITAKECENLYETMNHIAESVARFILNKNNNVYIINNYQLEQKECV